MQRLDISQALLVTLILVLVCAAASTAAETSVLKPRRAWTTSRIAGTPEPPPPFRIAPAFPGVRFDKPTSIQELPGEDRILVTEIGGKIFSFKKAKSTTKKDLVVDITKSLPSELAETGVSLFHATLHPKFSRNRFLYVCYVHPGDGGHTRVSRFTLTNYSPQRVVPNSERIVITWPSGGHNGGCLQFGKDGYLYISTGDGSGPNPPDGLTTGQDVSDLLGAVLRIDVDRTTPDRTYVVPSDNPFVDVDGARPEIWAYGLRNPWKFGVDSKTGEIFAADNGWETWEMVHRIVRGGNCGWPVMEGRRVLRSEVKPGPTPIIPPVKDHSHTEANSVIGGPVYRGDKLRDLGGSFVYGDYITGTIWALRHENDDTYSHSTLVDTDQRIVAFAEGSAGELFVLDYDLTGQIYELLPSGLKDNSASFPRRLSETGLFASLKDLRPATGVIPYNVQVNPWTDGAKSQRWVAIPGNGRIRLAAGDEPAAYPDGTVFVKHLSLPQGPNREPLRLETQILHYEHGQWHPYSYLWDEAGKDAHLVVSIGANRALQLSGSDRNDRSTERTWHVGAQNECKLCHNAGSQFVLGFVPNQLSRPYDDDDSNSVTHLAALAAQNVIRESPSIAADDPMQLVDPHDKSQDLNDRARSYLHANCASCHHPGGNAIVSFYLRRDLPLSKTNTDKGTGIGTFGMRNAKIIVAGDPYRSVLMYRMSKLGYARMPYIGSQVVDSAGLALIEQWIRSLSGNVTAISSNPLVTISPDATALQLLAQKDVKQRDRRDSAIVELTKSTEGSLALIARMHAGTLDRKDHDSAVTIGYKSSSSNIRGLFEHFIPESKRRKTLGPNINPEMILSRKGDHARGKLIFFSDAARCRACHDVNDPKKSTGPTLTEINKKYPRRSEMLQHALNSSLKIDDKFATYIVVTNDGRVVSGLKVEDNATGVVLKTAERKTIRIARDDIDEIQKSKKSLMPDRILSDLTAQEAADLLAYIRSLGDGS